MLCGLTGSGKTTYAQQLEGAGAVRLALHEEVERLVTKAGHTYPQTYLEYEPAAKTNLEQKLKQYIEAGRDVVLDYGFWNKSDRDRYKKLVKDWGGEWRLIYFKVDRSDLLKRLQMRNGRTDANALPVTAEMLDEFVARFEEPVNEGEKVID